MKSLSFTLAACAVSMALASCKTGPSPRELAAARAAMERSIPNEPLGDYFIGRRVFKVDYKMWGYVRRPRQSWGEARLVMLNENKVLAPDRALNAIGSDNGCEYKLRGRFSGDLVYEPASNLTYPEFVLEGAERVPGIPGPIFKDRSALKPQKRYYPDPY